MRQLSHHERPAHSWSRGPHHAVAGCVDCHLPHDFLPKYFAKAENGYHHSKAFTLQDFHEPIMIKSKNAGILQESCVRCHADFVHELVNGSKVGENAAVRALPSWGRPRSAGWAR